MKTFRKACNEVYQIIVDETSEMAGVPSAQVSDNGQGKYEANPLSENANFYESEIVSAREDDVTRQLVHLISHNKSLKARETAKARENRQDENFAVEECDDGQHFDATTEVQKFVPPMIRRKSSRA